MKAITVAIRISIIAAQPSNRRPKYCGRYMRTRTISMKNMGNSASHPPREPDSSEASAPSAAAASTSRRQSRERWCQKDTA